MYFTNRTLDPNILQLNLEFGCFCFTFMFHIHPMNCIVSVLLLLLLSHFLIVTFQVSQWLRHHSLFPGRPFMINVCRFQQSKRQKHLDLAAKIKTASVSIRDGECNGVLTELEEWRCIYLMCCCVLHPLGSEQCPHNPVLKKKQLCNRSPCTMVFCTVHSHVGGMSHSVLFTVSKQRRTQRVWYKNNVFQPWYPVLLFFLSKQKKGPVTETSLAPCNSHSIPKSCANTLTRGRWRSSGCQLYVWTLVCGGAVIFVWCASVQADLCCCWCDVQKSNRQSGNATTAADRAGSPDGNAAASSLQQCGKLVECDEGERMLAHWLVSRIRILPLPGLCLGQRRPAGVSHGAFFQEAESLVPWSGAHDTQIKDAEEEK